MAGWRWWVAGVAAVMVLGLLAVTGLGFLLKWRAWVPVEIVGVVLRDDADPKKQVPISQALVSGTDGHSSATARTDAAGYFHLKLGFSLTPKQKIRLTFEHPQYQPLEVMENLDGEICVARMQAIQRGRLQDTAERRAAIPVQDVWIRYSVKTTTTADIGGAAKIFEAPGGNGQPCVPDEPCSPDGKWKAAANIQIFDAGEKNAFRNTRLSCIAGPCPFTRIQEISLIDDERRARVAVLNWSDTATFLLEAEVTHTMQGNIVRQAYPAIFGSSMNFTLPASAEGFSIQAEMNGSEIVYPLGPALQLSWATCNITLAADNTRQFRCELRPGYEFR